MAFWKRWWKKKNESKKGAEYEDHPLPSEVEGSAIDDPELEQRIRARRNNLSVSRSGRFKAKGKERGQVCTDLFQSTPASGNCDATSAGDAGGVGASKGSESSSKGSFGKNSCREAQLALSGVQRGPTSAAAAMPASIH